MGITIDNSDIVGRDFEGNGIFTSSGCLNTKAATKASQGSRISLS